jgi:hypothetical protein
MAYFYQVGASTQPVLFEASVNVAAKRVRKELEDEVE